jgi:hypothetical protein
MKAHEIVGILLEAEEEGDEEFNPRDYVVSGPVSFEDYGFKPNNPSGNLVPARWALRFTPNRAAVSEYVLTLKEQEEDDYWIYVHSPVLLCYSGKFEKHYVKEHVGDIVDAFKESVDQGRNSAGAVGAAFLEFMLKMSGDYDPGPVAEAEEDEGDEEFDPRAFFLSGDDMPLPQRCAELGFEDLGWAYYLDRKPWRVYVEKYSRADFADVEVAFYMDGNGTDQHRVFELNGLLNHAIAQRLSRLLDLLPPFEECAAHPNRNRLEDEVYAEIADLFSDAEKYK